jgi:hypothetical protein
VRHFSIARSLSQALADHSEIRLTAMGIRRCMDRVLPAQVEGPKIPDKATSGVSAGHLLVAHLQPVNDVAPVAVQVLATTAARAELVGPQTNQMLEILNVSDQSPDHSGHDSVA